MGKIALLFLLSLIFVTTGCHNNHSSDRDEEQKEFILTKMNNYQGMIKLYRDKLNRREDSATRYKLAELYYQVEDYESSRHYLGPLLREHANEESLILESKNLLETGGVSDALITIKQALDIAPQNGEAHNLHGILLAQTGDYDAAVLAFKEARTRFVNDSIVLNNIAMVAILREDYVTARGYLMPLYSRGETSKEMLHNLVFTLVKLHDFQAAENILRQEKLYQEREGILEALVKMTPRPQQQLQRQYASIPKASAIATAAVVSEAKQAPLPPVPSPPVLASAKASDSSKKPEAVTKSPASENAALSVTGKLREISVVRSGQHADYFRITLESPYAINYRELESSNSHKRIFELDNIKLNEFLLQASKEMALKNPHVKKVSFYQKNDRTVMMDIDFDRKISRTKTFRISASEKSQERLVFDIYHG